MGKGITLTKDEAAKLVELLNAAMQITENK
jgi:hypothetical protein